MSSSTAPILELQGYGFSFGNKVIVAEATFRLPAEGISVLMGPVGTGKSSLLFSLAGLNNGNSCFRQWGEARLCGQPLTENHRPVLIRQNARLLADTLINHLLKAPGLSFMPSGERRDWIEKWLLEFNQPSLWEKAHQRLVEVEPVWQRIALMVLAVQSPPPLLLIDEPDSGLPDAEARVLRDFVGKLASRQKLLLVTHNQKHVRALAQDVLLLAGGRIQGHLPVHSFFAESDNPIIRQFVQTGSISLPAPDAKPEELAEHIPPPPPLPAAAAAAVQSFQAVAPYLQTSRYGVQTVADIGVYTNAFDARAPRGFVWVIPGMLAGCPQPGISNPIEYDLQLLARVGVTVLVTLTEEDLEQAPLREAGLRNLHLPVYDRGVPSMRQIYMLLHRMMRLLEQGDVLAIHCLAGLGRTGTVLAAWMIKEGGLTASEAIRRLRLLQPGFIQSAEQEAFLFNFEKDLIHRTL